MKYILVIDQGTNSTRASLYDLKGKVIKKSIKEFELSYPKPSYVEVDINIILNSVYASINEVLKDIDSSDIISLGITNQRETSVVFDKFGKAIYSAISWQCNRTNTLCDQLKSSQETLIHKKTGLFINPYFSASKIYWLLHNVPNALKRALSGELLFGTIDTYLMYILSEGSIFKTDVTNASRTMLYNIHEDCWDSDLCKIFDVPMSMLAEVCPSKYLFGYTSKNSIFKKEIPIYAVAGDQQASLFGHLCVNENETKVSYGNGCFALTNIKNNLIKEKTNLITTLGVRYNDKKDYVLEGAVFYAGSLVEWLQEHLGIIKNVKETEDYASKVEDTLGLYIIPTFQGLGTPYWNYNLKGAIYNLTSGINKYHLVRACLEAICYRVDDILKAIEDNQGNKVTKVYVDGGASNNNFIMQYQADISDLHILRPTDIETTSLGIYYLCLLGLNIYKDVSELKEMHLEYENFHSNMAETLRKERLSGWHNCLNKLLSEV